MNYAITPRGEIVPIGDEPVGKGFEVFSSANTLRLAAEANRKKHFPKYNPFVHLTKLYATIPGAGPKADIHGFEEGVAAIARLTYTKRAKSKSARASAPAPKKSAPGEGSKKDAVIALLRAGVTNAKICEITGWQPHTTRGFIATLNKKMPIRSTKVDGELVYTIQ